jgi:hypothetical protein
VVVVVVEAAATAELTVLILMKNSYYVSNSNLKTYAKDINHKL